MPSKNPHAYASRSAADLQEANPKDPNFKAKSANKKPQSVISPIGGTGASGKKGSFEKAVASTTVKGFDVNPGPKGLGLKFNKLANLRGAGKKTKTSY